MLSDYYGQAEWADTSKRHVGRWHRTPWWVFWKPKWFRRVYNPAGDHVPATDGWGWTIEYATDGQRARQYLEETFGT